jgi:hypothetical protein
MFPTKVCIIVADSLTQGQTVIFFTNDNFSLYMFSTLDTDQGDTNYYHTQDVILNQHDIPQLLNGHNDYDAYSVRFVIDVDEKNMLLVKFTITFQ